MPMATDQPKYESKVFNFPELLSALERSGKSVYGSHFKIYEEDHSIIFKLLVYFLRDEENATRLGINLKKGILLTGPVGCGKTSLMNLVRFITPVEYQHVMISTRKISFEFNREGYSIIEKYSTGSFKMISSEWVPRHYCFDDLGIENNIKYFGNECNVMAEILLSRYDLFITHGMFTHITTNLNSSELEGLYGNRVRSRMRSMLNLISFGSEVSDKRN